MDLALNTSTWDLDLKNGDLYFVKDQDDLTQYLRQKLSLWLTEWFLDETKGFPFVDLVYVKNPNVSVLASVFKKQILETAGVVELSAFRIDTNNAIRAMTVNFTVRSVTGSIDFSIPFGGGTGAVAPTITPAPIPHIDLDTEAGIPLETESGLGINV